MLRDKLTHQCNHTEGYDHYGIYMLEQLINSVEVHIQYKLSLKQILLLSEFVFKQSYHHKKSYILDTQSHQIIIYLDFNFKVKICNTHYYSKRSYRLEENNKLTNRINDDLLNAQLDYQNCPANK